MTWVYLWKMGEVQVQGFNNKIKCVYKKFRTNCPKLFIFIPVIKPPHIKKTKN